MNRKDKKESKSLKIIKKGFKTNEIVIYAIALMLVTAGYLNYTANVENNTIETMAEQNNTETNKIGENHNIANQNTGENKEKEEDIGDAKLVSNNDVNDGWKNELPQNNSEENSNTEQTNSQNEDYFVATKLQRDTNYADMISTYTKILEDSSIAEPQKTIAMQEITKINENKNAIAICENLLSTKEFKNYVVLINNESVNVVVQVEGGLTTDKVAQIQNIISRELNTKIENIHITEK